MEANECLQYYITYFIILAFLCWIIYYKNKSKKIFVDNDILEKIKDMKINPINNSGRMFIHPFSFKGRIRRKEYWLSVIALQLYFFPLNLTEMEDWSNFGGIIWFITYIFVIWFALAQSVKRCHDSGKSGWFIIIPFYIIPLLLYKGEKECNKYGSCPKEDYYKQLLNLQK